MSYTLRNCLKTVKAFDDAKLYTARNYWLYRALAVAHEEKVPAGIRIDPQEPEWPVIYFELPTGQVTWHVPQHPTVWDKHTTDEKYARVEQYLESQP